MKELIITFLASLMLAGCTKNSTVPTSINGKWYLSAINITSYHNNMVTGRSDSSVIAHTYYATFNTDGTGIEYNSVNDIIAANPLNFTYSGSGSSITLTFPQQTIDGVSYDPYQVNASVLTLAGNNLTLAFPIIIYGLNGDKETETQYFGK